MVQQAVDGRQPCAKLAASWKTRGGEAAPAIMRRVTLDTAFVVSGTTWPGGGPVQHRTGAAAATLTPRAIKLLVVPQTAPTRTGSSSSSIQMLNRDPGEMVCVQLAAARARGGGGGAAEGGAHRSPGDAVQAWDAEQQLVLRGSRRGRCEGDDELRAGCGCVPTPD